MREKIIHRADKIAQNGDVSALCFETPRPINLKRATWTIVDDLVTCTNCRASMEPL